MRDLDLDKQLGKLDDTDYHVLREKYMAHATEILQESDVLRGEGSGAEAGAEIEQEVAALRKQPSNGEQTKTEVKTGGAVKKPTKAGSAPDLFCPNCGRRHNPGDKFCARCGHALSEIVIPNQIRLNIWSAAWLCAALVMFLAVGWFSVAYAETKFPTEIKGQLTNGTASAPADSVANLPVTLFQITTAGPVTRRPDRWTRRFPICQCHHRRHRLFYAVNYAGIEYYSDIATPDVAASSPVTLTVYETQTLPANFTLDRVHLILDVQPKHFNGLQSARGDQPDRPRFFHALAVAFQGDRRGI